MARFPSASGEECLRALKRVGFETVRVSGSHHVLKRASHDILVVVPVHGSKQLKRKTLNSIIKSAGLIVEQFRELL